MKKVLNQLLVIVILFIPLTRCNQSSHNYIDNSIEVDALNIPIDSTQAYFPREMFPEVKIRYIENSDSTYTLKKDIIKDSYEDYKIEWYSEFLYEIREPLLFNRKIEKEIYRFSWLPSFNNSMIFRIEAQNKKYILYWKTLDFKVQDKVHEDSKTISETEWLNLKKLLKAADYWNIELGGNERGVDGSEWILEGVTTTKYKVISVWSPNKGAFREVCSFLTELSGLKLDLY